MRVIIKCKDVNHDDCNLSLESTDALPNDEGIFRIWKTIETGEKLIIYENNDGSIAKIESAKHLQELDSIKTQFLDQKQNLIESESAGIEFNDENGATPSEPQPYDPELIRVDPKVFSLKQTFELIEDGEIDLSPDFQRHFVWKEIEKRSRLIESIMLRIPLPVFYLAQDREGKYQVVDGLQRLTVIKQFLNNEFKLKNLEYLKDCEGAYFDKETSGVSRLDSKYVRRILQTQLLMNTIDPQTPVRVKFEIFKRLNQGGKPLKPQEIRNCMASVSVRMFINNLARSEEFKKATNYSVNPMRMEDQELILRFIGFYYAEIVNPDEIKYNGNMELFLDDTLDRLNHEKSQMLSEIEKSFLNSMKNALHLFGSFAFRKCTEKQLLPGARKQFLNKSLFTSWSVLLSRYDNAIVEKKIDSKAFILPLAREIENNEEFYESITNGTNDVNRIRKSFETARIIINKIL